MAVKLAGVLALMGGGHAFAQQPFYPPSGQQPYNPAPIQQAAAPGALQQYYPNNQQPYSPVPAPQPAAPTGLQQYYPGLPARIDPNNPNGQNAPGTYQPGVPGQIQTNRQSTAPIAPPQARPMMSSSGGRVLYFQKPADALEPNLNPSTDMAPVALSPNVTAPIVTAPSQPAAPVPATMTSTSAYSPQAGVPGTASEPAAQPQTPPVKSSTSQKKQPLPIPSVDPKVTQIPPRETIFQMYDNKNLEKLVLESIRREVMPPGKQGPITIPPFPPLPGEPGSTLTPVTPPGSVFQLKTASYPPSKMEYEPGYVIHRRLHFEEKNAERAGWDFGFIQPVVSTMYFYKDALLWPNSLMSGFIYGFWDTNEGKCLPGSPTPYYLYPPAITITGGTTEAALITGIAIILH